MHREAATAVAIVFMEPQDERDLLVSGFAVRIPVVVKYHGGVLSCLKYFLFDAGKRSTEIPSPSQELVEFRPQLPAYACIW